MIHAHVGAVRNTSIAAERMLEDLPVILKKETAFAVSFFAML